MAMPVWVKSLLFPNGGHKLNPQYRGMSSTDAHTSRQSLINVIFIATFSFSTLLHLTNGSSLLVAGKQGTDSTSKGNKR